MESTMHEQPTYYDAVKKISTTAVCGIGKHGDCTYNKCECECHGTKPEPEPPTPNE